MQAQGSSESVARRPDPSLEIVEGPRLTKKEQYEQSMQKQEPKRTAALKLIRARRDRVKFSSQAGLESPPAVAQLTSVTGLVASGTPTSSQPRRGRGYDPFAPVDKRKVKALQEFIKNQDKYPRRPKGSAAEWYWTFKASKQWLHDSHMDAAMCMLRRRYYLQPDLFRSPNIAFLDTDIQRYWTRDYKAFLDSPPNMYGSGKLFPTNAWSLFTGEQPVYYSSGKMWMQDVEHLYFPMHIGGDHWVAVWVSLTQRHITIWDSIPSHTTEREVAELVEPIAVILPHLIFDLAKKEEHKGTLEPFTHARIRDGVPRNVIAGDCGVYAFKFIECHALGWMPFPKALCDDNMKEIRAKLAAEIWDETKKTGADEVPVGTDVYDQS